jgi:hypothetical protein
MAIVMGLDQHRVQITAEWLDTETGEIGRARVSPAHREDVRRFLQRFAGQRLEAALEATTGWRFVAEELRTVDAEVHLAEPAETAARRGNKKRAKTDRADARHLRELLMIGRLPESWIPPDHLLDLRAKVRLRHTLVDQRGEWQQRIQSVLYHHGFPQRHGLLTGENRAWLDALELPSGARGQVTVALTMIDALDAQSAPITRELRLYARRQLGCKALMKHYGIGELTAVTILAELRRRTPVLILQARRSLRRPGHHRPSIRPAPCTGPPLPPRTAGAALGTVRGGPGRPAPRLPGPRLLRPGRRPARRKPRLPRPGPQVAEEELPHPARARRRRPPPGLKPSSRARQALHHPDAPRPAPGIPLPPPVGGRPPKTERPHRVLREDPITHHVADPQRVADQDKPGHSRAPHPTAPPRPQPTRDYDAPTPTSRSAHLTPEPGTDKRKSGPAAVTKPLVPARMSEMDPPRDEELLAASTGGDGEAFGVFYARHEDIVLAFFLRRSVNAEIAADLAAETFAQALRSAHRFVAGPAPAVAWLFGIARNVLADSLRRGRVEEAARRTERTQRPRLRLDSPARSLSVPRRTRTHCSYSSEAVAPSDVATSPATS